MGMKDAILKFLASKWTILIIMIVMALALPTTWHNMRVVFDAGQASAFWYIIAVFFVNVAAVLLAFWKFMTAISESKEKPQSQQAW